MEIINISSGYMSANSYILKDAETGMAAVVDPGGDSEHIVTEINRNGVEVKYILLTHGHYDHILALDNVKKYTGAQVCIHRMDNVCLSSTTFSLMQYIGRNDTFDDADILLEDGDEIYIGTQKVKVMYTPGHTAGSVCYITDSGILTGDTLFFESIGRSDFPGGDYDALESSVKSLFSIGGDAKLYPGHGPETTLEHERKFNPYVHI